MYLNGEKPGLGIRRGDWRNSGGGARRRPGRGLGPFPRKKPAWIPAALGPRGSSRGLWGSGHMASREDQPPLVPDRQTVWTRKETTGAPAAALKEPQKRTKTRRPVTDEAASRHHLRKETRLRR